MATCTSSAAACRTRSRRAPANRAGMSRPAFPAGMMRSTVNAPSKASMASRSAEASAASRRNAAASNRTRAASTSSARPAIDDQRGDRCGCGKGRHQQRARGNRRDRQRKPIEQLSEIEQVGRRGQQLRSPLVAARHALAAATIAASALASRTMRGRTIRTVSTAASTVEQTRVLKAHVATAAALRE